MLTIAVDAMGGDHCPKAEVSGAILATKSYNVRIILVGREEVVRPNSSSTTGGIPNASVFTMPVSRLAWTRALLKRCGRRRTPLYVSLRGWCAMGLHTVWFRPEYWRCYGYGQDGTRCRPGVDRPALAQVFPSLKNTPVVVVDVGATWIATRRCWLNSR
jgi:glycerol-3-phosphate acyltransferase PlsX